MKYFFEIAGIEGPVKVNGKDAQDGMQLRDGSLVSFEGASCQVRVYCVCLELNAANPEPIKVHWPPTLSAHTNADPNAPTYEVFTPAGTVRLDLRSIPKAAQAQIPREMNGVAN